MPKNSGSKWDHYFDSNNPGLRSYFDRVRSGQPDEYRTTFAEGSSVQEVLQEWAPTLEQLSDEWPSLVDFENDLRAKVGPMSIMKPLAERMDDIDSYYTSIDVESVPLSDRAVKAVMAEFSDINGLEIRRQSFTIDQMKKSTNSGNPFFTKRRNVVSKTKFCNLHRIGSGEYVQTLGLTKFKYLGDSVTSKEMSNLTHWYTTAVLGWRGQEGGPTADDVKQRVVWMFPFALNICELQGYQPLIEAAQHFNLVPAWVSMEAVDARITELFDTKDNDDLVVCTDFSKFDQHFNSNLSNAAWTILRSIFTDSRAAQWWLEDIFPIKYDIPLAYDYGKVRHGKHGMASGSGGTNCDETLAHRALQYEAAQEHNARLNLNSQCLGDDGILTYPGITVDDVVASYVKHGLDMNTDKQYASTHDCVYLRRWHDMNYRENGVCVGVYSTYRALGRLCEQERFMDPETWGPIQVALRQLSIIENVNHHPLRDKFAEFCMKRDKYRLGIDIPGFLDNIVKYAVESNENMPDFLGYTKSVQSDITGIADWWIVNYLRSQSHK